MSSWICDPIHFNTLERDFKTVWNGDAFNSYSLKKFGLYHYGETPKDLARNYASFFNRLRELNVLAHAYQYASHYKDDFDGHIKEQKELLMTAKELANPLTPLGVYNGLNCLHYQIEIEHLDGITSEYDLTFECLETIIGLTAQYICSQLPEDKTNTWTIK